jgi:membrane protein
VRFNIGLVVSVLLALWSSWSAAGMLMVAVNACYEHEEKRDFVWFNLRGLALALTLFGIATLGLIAVLPAAISLLPVSNAWGNVIALACWPILAGIAILALGIVYRYAPDRAQPKWQLLSWGAATATALRLFGSIAFTTFVSNVGSYDRTYGSLGAVMILLLWFYMSAYVTLVGAELNAEKEREAAQ